MRAPAKRPITRPPDATLGVVTAVVGIVVFFLLLNGSDGA
jgi:hypothetical protein